YVKVAYCLTELRTQGDARHSGCNAGLDGTAQESLAASIADSCPHGARVLRQGDRKKNRRLVSNRPHSHRPNFSCLRAPQSHSSRADRKLKTDEDSPIVPEVTRMQPRLFRSTLPPTARRLAVAALLAVPLLAWPAVGSADTSSPSYSGRAYVVRASALGTQVQPIANTGELPATGGAQE